MNKKFLYIILGIATIIIVGSVFLSQKKSSYDMGDEYVSIDTNGLAAAKATETIELNNGDTYELAGRICQKKDWGCGVPHACVQRVNSWAAY